jgi:hypothetical protein
MGKGASVVIGGKSFTVKKYITDYYGMVLYALLKRYRGDNAINVCSDIMADCVYKGIYKHWEDLTGYLCTAAYGRLCKNRKPVAQGETNNTEKAISDVATLRNAWGKYGKIPGLEQYITQYEIADYLGRSVQDAYKEMEIEEIALLRAIIRVYRKINKRELKGLQRGIYSMTMEKAANLNTV